MTTRLTTTKLTPAALRHARVIAAFTGERMYEAVERILAAEAVRLTYSAASSTGAPPERSGAQPPMGETER